MGILRLLVGKGLQIVARLDDDLSHLLGYRQHLLDVIHQSVIGHPFLGIFEHRLWINIHVVHLHVLNAVFIQQHLSHLHHRFEGRSIHIHLPVFRVIAIGLRHCLQADAEEHRQ